jgi:tetratricopeptide (TPR) repeat protein
MASKKSVKKREKARAKALYTQGLSPQKRFIAEACLVVLLAAGIYQMIKPLRAQWHYKRGQDIRNAVVSKIIDPKKHPEVMIRAIYELQRGLGLEPYNGEMWSCLGDLFNFTDQNQASMNSYRAALRYFRSPSIYINLGVIYVKLNMYDEAEEALNRALAFSPGQKDALKTLEVVQALRKGGQ